MSAPGRSRARDSFEAEIITIAPVRAVVRTRTSAAAIEVAARAAGSTAWIRVSDVADGISHADFHAWLSGERAIVRLDEHRDWYARDSAAELEPSNEAWFRHEDGVPFAEPLNKTVSRVQAMTALTRWLATGEMLPELTWE